jgi:hypothetical protein
MGEEAEQVKEIENQTGSREPSPQAKPSTGAGTTENQTAESESHVGQDTESENRVDLDYDINEDGTVGLSFELKRRYDIASKLGKVGGLLVTVGILIVIIAPFLYAINIIPTLSLLLTIIASPFGVGAGLITLSDKFEYFPGV